MADEKVVAVDGGHGMQTAGKRTPYIASLGRSIHENEFNRAVVAFAKVALERCGIRPIDVSPTDLDTPLRERVKMANNAKADLFWSVHFNAYDGTFAGPNPKGVTVYVYSSKTKAMGEIFRKYLLQGTKQVDRGVKTADFYVLRETYMPAVLTECGFMDSPEESMLMLNANFQKECAEEGTKAACEYLGVKYVPEKAPKEKTTAHVQVGAFKDADNAARLQAQLVDAGYTTYATQDKDLYRVGVEVNPTDTSKTVTALNKLGYHPYVTKAEGASVTLPTLDAKALRLLKVGDQVKIITPVDVNGTHLKVYYKSYTVMAISGSSAVVGRDGTITAKISTKNLELC